MFKNSTCFNKLIERKLCDDNKKNCYVHVMYSKYNTTNNITVSINLPILNIYKIYIYIKVG